MSLELQQDEEEDLDEGPDMESQFPPDPDDIWPRRLGHSVYDHFDHPRGKFEFDQSQLLHTRWAQIPMKLSLPQGTGGQRFNGINYGQVYVLDGMGAYRFVENIFRHIEDEEEGGLDFSPPSAIPGKMEMLDDTIRITPGKRRREKFSESDVSKRFFVYGNKDEDIPWRGASFSPSFYKCLVYPHVKDSKANTPFEWAFSRAEVAMAFVVAMGYQDDIPPEVVNRPFARTARDAVNLHPAELNGARKFPNTAEAKKYMAVLKCNWKEPIPEAVCFALENAEHFKPEFFQDESVRNLIGKMETWLDNGLVVDRLTELFQALAAKKMDTRHALKYSLQFIDEIYGKQNPPWYFHENFSFKSVVGKANLGIESPEQAAEVLLLIAKHAGHDFQYAADLYYTARTKHKLEKIFPRQRSIEIASKICHRFGIGNIQRARNIVNILADNLARCPAKDHEETANLFLEHIERQIPSSEIQGRLQGEEVNVKFPSFDTLFTMFRLHDGLNEKERVFDDVTMGSRHFELVQSAIAQPLKARAALPPAVKGAARAMLFQHPLLPAAAREEQKCFPLPPRNQRALAKYEGNEKGFLRRVLEFYKQLNQECVYNQDGTATLYFAVLASKMPDPLNPPAGLLELLSRIDCMQETEITDAYLFSNPRTNEYEERRVKLVPRKYTRSLAVAAIVELWLKGDITDERFRAIIDFLNGKDIVVEHEMSLEDYIASAVNNTVRNFEDYREPMTEAEKAEKIEWSKERAAEHYEQDKFHTKSRKIEQRTDRAVSFALTLKDAQAFAARLGITGTPAEKMFMNMVMGLMTTDESKLTASNQHFYSEEESVTAKLADWFTFLSSPKIEDYSGLGDSLNELTNSKTFNMEEFVRQLREQQSDEEKAKIIYEFFKEIGMMMVLKTILIQVKSGFQRELGMGRPVRPLTFSRTETENLDGCKLGEFVRKLNARLNIVEGIAEDRFRQCKYLPEEMFAAAMSEIRRLREATAVVSAVQEIQEHVRREIEKKPLLLDAGKKTPEEMQEMQDLAAGVRNVTRISLGIMGAVAAVSHSEELSGLIARKALPEGVTALPGSHALVVHKGGAKVSGEELTPVQLRQTILQKFRASLPQLRDWVETVRTEDIGMLPVGGKIHTLHPIDEEAFERIKNLLGLTSTAFKLIHAGQSVILPASITSKEFTLLVFCLQKLGFITDEFPELQVGGPGRLPNRGAAILGSSVLLATELGKQYPRDSFVTNQDHLTAARIMAYDAGQPNDRLPYMKMPNGKTLSGRIDMLGRRSLGDVDLYRLVHTSLVHAEFGMAFKDIGEWYRDEYEKLLKKYGLDWILKEPWVFNSEKEKTAPPAGSQERHYEAINACTSAYFDCADGKNDIVYRVRDLLGQLSEKIRERQKEIARDPKAYADICEESKIAVNF